MKEGKRGSISVNFNQITTVTKIVDRCMPGGIDDLIKVLVAMDRCCFHLLLFLQNFFLSSVSCPAQTVAHQAFEPGSRSTHHDPEHE